LRVPDTGPVQTEADLDGALIEKVFLVERALRLVDGLFSRFIQVRISESWQGETVAAIRKWIGK
jgi:recombination associated protein RdgC